jgi:hypothetical protein
MRRFVAGAAALFAAAIACASGRPGFDTDPGPDADVSDQEGDAAVEAGEPSEASTVNRPDGGIGNGGRDASGNGNGDGSTSTDASLSDAGPSDDSGSVAEGDADASPPPATSGSCDPTQWTVTASASAPNNPPAFAIDGLPPTRWSTGVGQTVGQYFQIDFGGAVVVDQIVLDDSFASTTEAQDYPRGVSVLGSTDGTNFATTVTTVNYTTDPGAIATMSFAPTTTRAIRMQLTTGVPTLWWAIHELRVDCHLLDGGAPPPPSDAGTGSCAATSAGWTDGGISHTGWVATASSVGPNDTIAGGIDGNASTRWSSGQAQAGGEWFKVDLGQPTMLSGVGLYLLSSNTTDYPSSYALQLSTDDLTYQTVASGLGAATTSACIPRQPARYVKVTQTGTGDTSWWSVYEMSVFP